MQTPAALDPGMAAGPAAAGAAVPAPALAPCANCGAAVTGNYCAQCGQRHEHAVHSFWHFLREVTEDLTHADSRLWRTLGALLMRPGLLTREFLDGRRASYLPPIRLYLVLSVIFFLVIAIAPQAVPTQALVQVKGSEIILKSVNTPQQAASIGAARAQEICSRVQTPAWASRLEPRIDASCVSLLRDNGRKFYENLLHNAGRAMFVLLPLLALVMKALYLRQRRHYVEHLLFFVHNHACLFLVLAAYELLAAFAPAALHPVLHAALWIYVPVYFYTSMRRVYRQGWLITGTKLAALYCAYLTLGTMMLALTSAYSFFTL